MTLTEMLSQPHPELKRHPRANHPAWFSQDKMPRLETAEAGQVMNLYSWLIFDERAAECVPPAWRDRLACAPFAGGLPLFGGTDWALAVARHVGGEAVRAIVRDIMRGAPVWTAMPVLLHLDGANALPLLANHFTKRGIEEYAGKACVCQWFANARERTGVSLEVWDLSWIAEKSLTPEKLPRIRAEQAKHLEGFQLRGLGLTLGDMRALASHPAHAENMRGLVLGVRTASGEIARTFVLPDEPVLEEGESIVIPHPAQVSEDERAEWRRRLAHEGRTPPFDQWRGAQPAAKPFEVTSYAADPLPLMLHLASRGWQRGPAQDDGAIKWHSKPFPDLGVRAIVEHEPIPVVFGAGTWQKRRLTACRFEGGAGGKVSPVAVAVVAADLEGLA